MGPDRLSQFIAGWFTRDHDIVAEQWDNAHYMIIHISVKLRFGDRRITTGILDRSLKRKDRLVSPGAGRAIILTGMPATT